MYTSSSRTRIDARAVLKKESEHGEDLSRSAHKVQDNEYDNERSFHKRACNLRIHVSTYVSTHVPTYFYVSAYLRNRLLRGSPTLYNWRRSRDQAQSKIKTILSSLAFRSY